MQKGVLRESAQGRQKRPNKQKPPPPRVSHTAKREPGSSRPDQAVQTPHRPPSTAPGGGSLPLSARGAGRRWQGREVSRETEYWQQKENRGKKNPQPLGTSICPGGDKTQQCKPPPSTHAPFFGPGVGKVPGDPSEPRPNSVPRGRAARAPPAASAPLGLDPRPSPYLPQHFPAVGTEQVVGGGRRAAAAPVHRGCGRRRRRRTAGPGLGITAAARAAAGSDRPPAAGCASASASLGRNVGMAGDGQRTSGAARGDHRGGCRSAGGDGGGCSSPARCSSRPHPPDPRPRQARTSSRHRCRRLRRRRSASVRPRPRLPTTFTTSTLRYRPLPPFGQPRPRPWASSPQPMNNQSPVGSRAGQSQRPRTPWISGQVKFISEARNWRAMAG